MAINVYEQMSQIMDEYSEEVKQKTNQAIKNVANKSVRTLRSTSPKRTGSYARGWRTKIMPGPGGILTIVVHNSTNYQLTHLLERGHVIRNKKGTYGRTAARPHIAPVEAAAIIELPQEIERELG